MKQLLFAAVAVCCVLASFAQQPPKRAASAASAASAAASAVRTYPNNGHPCSDTSDKYSCTPKPPQRPENNPASPFTEQPK
jgi:hypothetical protein